MEVCPLNSSDSSTPTGKAPDKAKAGHRRYRPAISKRRSSPSVPALPRPWKRRPPVAPPPPTPKRVYNVDSESFKDVVQMLTGADPKSLPVSPAQKVLQRKRPSPVALPDVLEVCRYGVYFPENSLAEYPLPRKATQLEPSAGSNSAGALFTYSSNSAFDWSPSIPLMSPGTLSSFGMGTLL